MNPIITLVRQASEDARAARAQVFRARFQLGPSTRILDLGSENGANINLILRGTAIKEENVYIADIDPAVVNEGHERFGYVPVVIDEAGKLPFDDAFFDIVYCSSVIAHVNGPKEDLWSLYSGKEFKDKSFKRQKIFANEIKRVGKQYFVQTPYKHFPVESSTWLPFLSWLPRRILIPTLKITNPDIIEKKIEVSLNVETEEDFRRLEIYHNKNLRGNFIIGKTQSIIKLFLDKVKPGENLIEFRIYDEYDNIVNVNKEVWDKNLSEDEKKKLLLNNEGYLQSNTVKFNNIHVLRWICGLIIRFHAT